MSVNKKNILNLSKDRDMDSDFAYEDDGFFSDVPTSGSLSRSQLALNKFMKKNLLYEENEYENDGAYFSKESSPNESAIRYDSDSAKSNVSTEKEEPVKTILNRIKTSHIGIQPNMTVPINEPRSDFHAKTIETHIIDSSNIPTVLPSKEAQIKQTYISTLPPKETHIDQNYTSTVPPKQTHIERNYVSTPAATNFISNLPPRITHIEQTYISTLPTRATHIEQNYTLASKESHIEKDLYPPPPSRAPLNKMPNATDQNLQIKLPLHEIPNATEQTDDYKYKQLRDNSNNNSLKKSLVVIEYSDIRNESATLQAEQVKSASLDDLTNDYGTPIDEEDNTYSESVVIREKRDVKREENRHTIHDVSDWVNRTEIYPDVYAPLPYKSPSRRYVESDVNIHYRCPVRHDPLPLVPEKELARQQAEHMKRLYREQKRNKYLQELQDMQNRRHQDNFTPSQKNILPLNRYDEAEKVVAKALYTFNGQTNRELSFRKGDIIHVRRQIDSNWYEGEIHGRIGLFPYNYVEIQKGDTVQAPKKPAIVEGRARAKFDFTAQTNLELPLKKGEVVVLTRRIDQNWWEGRNGQKMGIFPDSYVTILQEPSQNKPEPQQMYKTDKPVASPAAHGLMNGSAKRSMGAHSYMPQQNSQALSNAPPATQPLPGYATRKAQPAMTPSERGYGPPTGAGVDLNNTEPLYVDTNAEAIPYRAMYKYRPQNPDELELNEGDTVYVLEKCDDGWYVGSSQRTGRFGTFPGNYVERI